LSGRFDVAIVGSGLGGSMLAGIAARLGRSVLLVERGAHPRFALGESTTPLSNLVLADLARRYGWRELFERSSWGRWRRAQPSIPAGLKRGFTFLSHREGAVPTDSPEERLLVAASDRDEAADLQWMRAPLDAWLVAEARRAGAVYLDRTETRLEEIGEGGAALKFRREGESLQARVRLLVDASGEDGFLARELALPARPRSSPTRALYGHFRGVPPLAGTLATRGHDLGRHPYPCEFAAVHHLFDGGWMWHLRFDDGLVSAGFVLDERAHPPDPDFSPDDEWSARIARFPLLDELFGGSETERPVAARSGLARTVEPAAGPAWAMLPHAAYFADPLLSGGIPHTLLAVERLARLLETWPPDNLAGSLEAYGQQILEEADGLSQLVEDCYRSFARFDLFSTFVMHYFVAASSLESARRSGRPEDAAGFLRLLDPAFRGALEAGRGDLDLALSEAIASEELCRRIAERLSPWNGEGFCDPAKENLYPSPVRPEETWLPGDPT
jgi:FADH2 O2-dependent halogenase